MSFTIVVITELLAKHVPLMPVADIRNSAKDDAFVHFIVELSVCTSPHTTASCFLFYFAYTRAFLQLVWKRDLFLCCFFFLLVCSLLIWFTSYNPSYSSLQKDI